MAEMASENEQDGTGTGKDHEDLGRTLTPEFALLGFLYQQPTYGYELYQRLATELNFVWHVSMSQAYNIIRRLERQGLVTGTVHVQDKRPAQRHLKLTPAGEARFQKWLQVPPRDSLHVVRTDFLTRLHFVSQLYPGQVPALLDAQEAQAIKGIARLKKQLPNIPEAQTVNRLGVELRLRQLSALVQWIEVCRKRYAVQQSK